MKTPQEWAEYLPEPIRTEFLENVIETWVISNPTKNLETSINFWFNWSKTPQGHHYWAEIHQRALNGEFSKPIPTFEKVDSYKDALLKKLEDAVDGKVTHVHLDQPKPTEKMTAVEWLIAQFKEYGFDFSHHEREIDQAKSMEKEQIENAFVAGDERGTKDIPFNCEQYYSQTFGGDK